MKKAPGEMASEGRSESVKGKLKGKQLFQDKEKALKP